MFGKITILLLSAAVMDDFLFSRFNGGSGDSSSSGYEHSDGCDTAKTSGLCKAGTLSVGAVTALLMLLTALLTQAETCLVLIPLGVEALRPLAALLTAVLSACLLYAAAGSSGNVLIAKARQLLPFAVLNCAVIGTVLLTDGTGEGFLAPVLRALACGAAFAVVSFLFEALVERTELSEIPEAFKGLPIRFLIAALIALVALGYSGLY